MTSVGSPFHVPSGNRVCLSLLSRIAQTSAAFCFHEVGKTNIISGIRGCNFVRVISRCGDRPVGKLIRAIRMCPRVRGGWSKRSDAGGRSDRLSAARGAGWVRPISCH